MFPIPLDQPEFAVAAYGALAGALAGALVTGSISYLLQRHAFNEMKKQQEEDRKRSQQALGRTMLFKMLKIRENLRSLNQVFTNTVARQRGATEEELWRYVRASANLPDRVHFSPEEMAMLSAMKDDNVFATVLQVDDFHNAVLDTPMSTAPGGQSYTSD